MEMSQGNSLCSYHKETKMSLFSFINLGNRRVDQVLSGNMVPVGGGRRWEKDVQGEYGANTVHTCM
jgi:hypothetical protein